MECIEDGMPGRQRREFTAQLETIIIISIVIGARGIILLVVLPTVDISHLLVHTRAKYGMHRR